MYQTVTDKLIHLVQSGFELVICPQIIYEFYVIVTRPTEANGFGLSPFQANREIKNLTKVYSLLAENETVFMNWIEIVNEYDVKGKVAHDARVVALMRTWNVYLCCDVFFEPIN